MARQIGTIRIKGNLGDLSFYETKAWGNIVRRKGGPSKQVIENRASCQSTRDNMREFKGAVKMAAGFRYALGHLYKTNSDTNCLGRLNGIFRRICLLGDGLRGMRAIRISAGKHLLDGVEFNTAHPFASIYPLPIHMSHNPSRTLISLSFTDFCPIRLLQFPSGASHFRFVVGAVSLSDYVYNQTHDGYLPLVPEKNLLHTSVNSALLEMDAESISGLNLDAQFADVDSFTSDVNVVVCVGIEFWQRVNGVDYALRDGRAMRVLGTI